jgi:hypothetical protein
MGERKQKDQKKKNKKNKRGATQFLVGKWEIPIEVCLGCKFLPHRVEYFL